MSDGPARLLFFGDAILADGFRLIGFETWPDPAAGEVEKILDGLHQRRENAFVIIDRRLAEARIPAVERIRAEGGHQVLSTVPPLTRAEDFHCDIDRQIRALTGGGETG